MKTKKLLNSILKAGILGFIFAAFVTLLNPVKAFAKPLDEILDYTITVDVLDDATLDMTYDITWKVLDGKSEGPLEWVKIGIPNNHYSDLVAVSDNISRISTMKSGGTYVRVDFDRKYKTDEIVHFIFKIRMDYMYQVYPEEGIAEYTFIPGWFDDIAVDNITVKWNENKNIRFSPACIVEDGYLTFTDHLSPKEKMTIKVAYPMDAFKFDLTMHEIEDEDDDYKFSEHSIIANIFFVIMVAFFSIIMVAICASPILVPLLAGFLIYKAKSGLSGQNKKEITRTIIEYYPSCPNCGGIRETNKEECAYCGSNMVKSRQIVKENDVKEEDKEILNFNTDGEYHYSSNPNRYCRVHVVSVPIIRTTGLRSSGGSHHSCAHSSCACACACACAGGGRAGCTTKDFYNTNFKLSYLKKYKSETYKNTDC